MLEISNQYDNNESKYIFLIMFLQLPYSFV